MIMLLLFHVYLKLDKQKQTMDKQKKTLLLNNNDCYMVYLGGLGISRHVI